MAKVLPEGACKMLGLRVTDFARDQVHRDAC